MKSTHHYDNTVASKASLFLNRQRKECCKMNLSSLIADSITEKARFGTSHAAPNAISIGFGINARYARPMGVTITSIAANNPDVLIDFHVFVNSIDQIDVERLEKLSEHFSSISITVYQVNDTFIAHLPTHNHLPLPTYFRFFMPLILKDNDKILYLDADILCLNKISELIHLNMENYPAAVIADIAETADKQVNALQLQTELYFNAGVLLINVPEWLKQNITEKALSLLADRSQRFLFLDQDALNIILQDRKMILPKKWNYISETDNNATVPDDVVFLHCAARPKPWEIACDKASPAHRLYAKYEKRSPWQGLPLMLPTMPTDARIYSERLFANGNILLGVTWYFRYLKLKYRKRK